MAMMLPRRHAAFSLQSRAGAAATSAGGRQENGCHHRHEAQISLNPGGQTYPALTRVNLGSAVSCCLTADIDHDCRRARSMSDHKTLDLEYQERTLLDTVPLFAGLPETTLCRLAKEPSPLNLDRGTFLFQQEHPASDVHVILQGWIKLFRMDETGTETTIRMAGAGDILGHDDLLLHQCHQMCAEAVSTARILILDGKKLAQYMRRDPAMALRVAASLAEQVQFLTRHVEELKLLDALQRTAHFLLGLCSGQVGRCSLSLPYEKAVIAGWLGMKPASFSRALASLRRFGVTVDRETVSISDTRRLAALIEMSPRDTRV
ncbi:MAG TPA: Crp/Fnr family transcriptional regulator [Hyphomicrobium sp.]|nr:Crp/Fnr family transcriptional regulator [Hyphomicrobium sp.]